MHVIDKIYINGMFAEPHGSEHADLRNPTTEEVIGQVTLADREDTIHAIEAAKRAFPAFSRTTRRERIIMLQRLHDNVLANGDQFAASFIQEYGGTASMASYLAATSASSFLDAAKALERYSFIQTINAAEVVMMPLGVVGIITPWNFNSSYICEKLGMAIAAGCTTVIKPSEMSAIQTQILTESLHKAGLPPGIFNVITGRGDIVGAEMSAHPDIAKISFTGSTVVGKKIMHAATETMKRVTLELGGKSPTVILDEADFATAIPLAIMAGFGNNGQACVTGTRILVPENRLEEVCYLAKAAVERVKIGDPGDPQTTVGPLVSHKQFERVQRYIKLGLEEGAQLLVGGEGRPAGLDKGYFVKPTIFTNVTNDMTIAREEIFGPVLCIITYRNEEEAIRIANDTVYGLHAYVISSNLDRAHAVASNILAGSVLINGWHHEPLAPFGGFKQSGLGRDRGVFGLESHLEPKVILGYSPTAI